MSALLGPDGMPYVAKGIPTMSGGSLTGDPTVAAVLSAGNNRGAMSDLQTYWMLVTKHPYVRSCIELIADAASAEGYDVAPVEEADAKPLSGQDDNRVGDIRKFFRTGFVGLTERAARRAAAIDLLGYGYTLWERKRGFNNTLVALERLDPRTVQAKLTADRSAIDSYVVASLTSNGAVNSMNSRTVKAKDMLFIAQSGGDTVTGFASPLEALDLTAATDMSQRLFRKVTLDKAAFIGTALVNKTAIKEQVDAAVAQVKAKQTGAANALSTLVLTGDWDMVHAASAGKNDADFVNGTKLNREDICGVYHVPVGMLTFSGSAMGSAGKGDDRDFFEQFAVLPLEETFYEALSLSIMMDEWGIDDIQLVPKRRNRVRLERFDAAMQMIKFGATANQALQFVNMPSSALPGMDTPLFLGIALPGGLAAQEPVDPNAPAPAPEAPSGDAAASAVGADAEREVAQKGLKRFRDPRENY